jgi:cell division protein ZapA (FtsZ GTPase activity inhibitor)
MDWIAEQIYTLIRDIQTGNIQNNDQIPAIIITIVIFGCILARKQIKNSIRDLITHVKTFFYAKKLRNEIDEERERIDSILSRVEAKVHELDHKKWIFEDERDKALQSINTVRADVRDEIEREIVPGLRRLEENYSDSLEIVEAIEQLLEQVLNRNRAKTIRSSYKQMAEELFQEEVETTN